MSLYDEIRAQYRDVSIQEKLSLLGYAKHEYLSVIRGYAQILKTIDSEEFTGLPDDYSKWCERIIAASDAMTDTIDGILDTDENNRESRKQQQVERTRDLNNLIWSRQRAELSELSDFSSFHEAAVEMMKRKKLSLSEEILHPFYEIESSLFLRKDDREFIGGPQASQSDGRFYAYSFTLKMLVGRRNRKWVECEAMTPSLEEFVNVLHSWLVAHWSIDEMKRQFSCVHFPSSFSELKSDDE